MKSESMVDVAENWRGFKRFEIVNIETIHFRGNTAIRFHQKLADHTVWPL